MKTVAVRYKLKPDCVTEHEELLREVFEALSASAPEGLTYEALKLEDGVSFIHVARVSGATNPLTALEAFKKFTADIKSRCEDPPASSGATIFGAYGAQRVGESA